MHEKDRNESTKSRNLPMNGPPHPGPLLPGGEGEDLGRVGWGRKSICYGNPPPHGGGYGASVLRGGGARGGLRRARRARNARLFVVRRARRWLARGTCLRCS